jgi:hypothetical protein
MLRIPALFCFLGMTLPLAAVELQGYLADWNCVKDIVRNGEKKTFQKRKSCSLQENYNRPAYGVITDDKKFYRLDEEGKKHALELLSKSPSRDVLHVVVTGNLNGNLIKVTEMSLP